MRPFTCEYQRYFELRCFRCSGYAGSSAAPSAGSAGKSNLWTGTYTSIAGAGTPFTASPTARSLSAIRVSTSRITSALQSFLTTISLRSLSRTHLIATAQPPAAFAVRERAPGPAESLFRQLPSIPLFDAGSATPEPTTVLLFGAGWVAFLFVRRRRS